MNPNPLLYANDVPMAPSAIAVSSGPDERNSPAVSWGAIFAGAAAAAALSLILLILGTGLGLSAVSPFSGRGIGSTSLGTSTILWLTATQLIASGMGGYLAGRLRTRWIATHRDEVFFRDTAHGFLAWAVASLATAALLTSVIGSIVGTGVQAGAALTGGAVAAGAPTALTVAAPQSAGNSAGDSSGRLDYFVDSLFRNDPVAASSAQATSAGPLGQLDPVASNALPQPLAPSEASIRSSAEAAAIFANAVADGVLPDDDRRHLANLIAARTGIAQSDAEKRVSETFVKLQSRLANSQALARETAEKARKASAYAALWLFISLLAGAFVASLFATVGGRQRDL